ncbi:hypothetical protein QUB63_33350 [Microcoleus sp. ARI1-B5]|uniref:hypothetical protein n=1 Tax=unclassified Microcoleus TaxID=2642155 RepID=UPI002FD3F6B5
MRFRKQGQRCHILSDLYPLWGMIFQGGRSPKSLGRSKNRVSRQFPEPSGMQKNH